MRPEVAQLAPLTQSLRLRLRAKLNPLSPIGIANLALCPGPLTRLRSKVIYIGLWREELPLLCEVLPGRGSADVERCALLLPGEGTGCCRVGLVSDFLQGRAQVLEAAGPANIAERLRVGRLSGLAGRRLPRLPFAAFLFLVQDFRQQLLALRVVLLPLAEEPQLLSDLIHAVPFMDNLLPLLRLHHLLLLQDLLVDLPDLALILLLL